MRPNIITTKTVLLAILAAVISLSAGASAVDLPATCFLMHSSGLHMVKDGQGHAALENPDVTGPQMLTITSASDGYYNIFAHDGSVLSLSGDYDACFLSDASSYNAQYAIEAVSDFYVTLRCRANGKYVGVDNTSSGSWAYSNKEEPDYWYLSSDPAQAPAFDECSYIVAPGGRRHQFEGWGVSLCWWANMCGKWSDDKIDRIIDWLVSPDGLNYNIFRYNIGGGDDPSYANCREHHMRDGKGARAEMEGFKDSSSGPYIWSRDEAQRKIMLKIKEKRPDAIFEAFSNSAPYYMTYSGCVAGHHDRKSDNLCPECYGEFADYLIDVCRHYKDEYGIEFRTLEPFNEPMTDYWYAGGEQEGCHFDVGSQIDFLKVLAPKLRQSGLSTTVAVSDETSVNQSVLDFIAYRDAGVLDMVGQWNTHSYTADDFSRAKLSSLCNEASIRLWMSEVGADGSGIRGNLNLARRLVDDIRFMMPSAWIDWQYIEENHDQWGLVTTNDYLNGDAWRTKNYFVRSQFSRFIEPGSTVITSLNPNTLAALTPDGDRLVIVALNTSPAGIIHRADLSAFESVQTPVAAYITDPSHDMALFSDYELGGTTLTFSLPPTSVATLIVPVTTRPLTDKINPDASYLLCPRTASDVLVTADDDGVRLKPMEMSPAQQWRITRSGDLYEFTNLSGQILTETDENNYYLDREDYKTGSQGFRLNRIDPVHYYITNADGSRAFDLEGESSSVNTRVGLWRYDDTPDAPVHRQWSLIELPQNGISSGGTSKCIAGVLPPATVRVLTDIPGRMTVESLSGHSGPLRIYNVRGVCVYSDTSPGETVVLDMPAGFYVVSVGSLSVQTVVK